jgi:hypothetical protein
VRPSGRLLRRLPAAILLLGAACAAAPPDETAFTREMAKKVKAAVPSAKLKIAGPLTIEVESREGGQISLDRVYEFCRTNPAQDCSGAKARFVTGIAETLTATYTVTRDRLRLVVRGADYCRGLAIEYADKPERLPLHKPLAKGLCQVVMAQFESTARLIGAADLEALALDAEATFALARMQVLATLPMLAEQTIPTGALVAIDGFDHIPSLMLDRDAWSALKARLGEQMVVAVPADTLLLIGTAEGATLEAMRRGTAENYASAERGISREVYRWSRGRWVVAR